MQAIWVNGFPVAPFPSFPDCFYLFQSIKKQGFIDPLWLKSQEGLTILETMRGDFLQNRAGAQILVFSWQPGFTGPSGRPASCPVQFNRVADFPMDYVG